MPTITNVASSDDEIAGHRGDQVEALLIDHPRHHADHRPRQQFIGDREAERLEQRALGRGLSVEAVGVERRRQERIRRGIPLVVIDAVQDADQRIAARCGSRRQARCRTRDAGSPRA